MAETSYSLPTLYLKHRGLFNHSAFVQAIQQWYIDNGYKYTPGKFKLKANEAEYEAEGERDIHEYVKFKVGIHVWIRDIADVDVVKDGEKKKMQDGYLQIEVMGEINMDPNKRFAGSKFLQRLQDFYHKYVIKQTINDVWEDDLFLKMNELMGTIKNVLGTEAS